MAGFLDIEGIAKFRNRFTEMSRFGMKWDDLLVKNSQAIGFIEGQMSTSMNNPRNEMMRLTYALSDTTSAMKGKSMAMFQMEYAQRREKLREIAAGPEIEFVLDTIASDAIVYDNENRFCLPSDLRTRFTTRKSGIKSEKTELKYQERIKDHYYDSFDKIYDAWGFNMGQTAWLYMYQYLIEGQLAFEIIYDSLDKPKNIIGFKELDAATITPIVNKDPAGKIMLEWLQRDASQPGGYRRLADSQVIYVSFSNYFKTRRISFVERMVRSYNLLRIMEQSKIIWHVMNTPNRFKTEIPIGSKSVQKAREDMNEFLSTFREDIHFNSDSGELMIDGQAKILFYKNYIVPVNERGEKINIEPLQGPTLDLQNDQLLNYFFKKLKLDAKIPGSRWENAEGNAFIMGPDSVSREEIAYEKFINRLRISFQELLIKPWYIQVCLNEENLKNDYMFKNAMGLEFVDENLFAQLKKQELAKKGAETVTALLGIKPSADDFFPVEYLAKEYMQISDSALEEIAKIKAKSKVKAEQGQEEAQSEVEGGGGESTGGGVTGSTEEGPLTGAETGETAEETGAPEEGAATPEEGAEPVEGAEAGPLSGVE
jgi:hypothetical protein